MRSLEETELIVGLGEAGVSKIGFQVPLIENVVTILTVQIAGLCPRNWLGRCTLKLAMLDSIEIHYVVRVQ